MGGSFQAANSKNLSKIQLGSNGDTQEGGEEDEKHAFLGEETLQTPIRWSYPGDGRVGKIT